MPVLGPIHQTMGMVNPKRFSSRKLPVGRQLAQSGFRRHLLNSCHFEIYLKDSILTADRFPDSQENYGKLLNTLDFYHQCKTLC
jgi:hypothetical protein